MNPFYKPPFKKFVKKQARPLQLSIEDEIEKIIENPKMGEIKKGDLREFFLQSEKISKGRCLAMITAEKVYKDILEMPVPEREKLFATIARKGFEKDLYTHDEVFDDIRKSPFSLREAAEYLKVAEITVRRWAKAGKLNYQRIGKNFVFDPDELKEIKKQN